MAHFQTTHLEARLLRTRQARAHTVSPIPAGYDRSVAVFGLACLWLVLLSSRAQAGTVTVGVVRLAICMARALGV